MKAFENLKISFCVHSLKNVNKLKANNDLQNKQKNMKKSLKIYWPFFSRQNIAKENNWRQKESHF